MRPSRVWFNQLKPAVQERGYACVPFERHSEAHRLVKYAMDDGFVAEISGGYVRVAAPRIVERAAQI